MPMSGWWCAGLGGTRMTVTQPEWVQQLFRAVRPLLPKDFVGRIEINCHKGDTGNINVIQSFKAEEKKR